MEIEYRQEKAAKESSPEAIAEKKRKEEAEFIKRLDGGRWRATGASEEVCEHFFFEVNGDEIAFMTITDNLNYADGGCHLNPTMGEKTLRFRTKLHGRNFTVESRDWLKGWEEVGSSIASYIGTISEDGAIITVQVREKYQREGTPLSSTSTYKRVNTKLHSKRY